jgi:sugar (pentulose or hexulose) kinase
MFHKIAHFVLPVDFLRGKLLGNNSYTTDPTNAFGTGLFNTRLNFWHTELIRKFQLPLNIFPEVHPASQKAGRISGQVADLVGLDGKIPIVHGGGDNQMSMLGSGLAVPDSPVLINIGTAAQISKVVSAFVKYPGLDTRSFFQGFYVIVGASLGGGGCYQWLRERIRHAEGVDIDYSQLDEMAAKVPPGADGLVFCTGPTRQKTRRRRSFYGNMARLNSIAHRARAVMEGVLMDLYDSYEILKSDDRCDYFVGGGKGLQKSTVWPRIAADLFGKPVRTTGYENALFGAALMAAYGLGFIENLEESVHAVGYSTEMKPDPEHAKFYRDEFVNSWRAAIRDR